MADKRMLSRSLILSDEFIELSATARWLYTALVLTADDDGFVVSIQSLLRQVKATRKDLELLRSKNYIIVFKSGPVAIRHWHVHNSIKKDRYKSTLCVREKALLYLNDDGVYEEYFLEPKRSQDGAVLEHSSRVSSLDKDNIELDIGEVVSSAPEPTAATESNVENVGNSEGDDIDEDSPEDRQLKPFGEDGVVMLSDNQVDALLNKVGLAAFNTYLKRLSSFIIKNNATVQNHYKTILKWVAEDSQT